MPTLSLVQETLSLTGHIHPMSSYFSIPPTINIDVFMHGGFGANFFYGRMPILTPTLLFFPDLGPTRWCAGLHTPRQSLYKLDEANASGALIVVVFGSDGRVDGNENGLANNSKTV